MNTTKTTHAHTHAITLALALTTTLLTACTTTTTTPPTTTALAVVPVDQARTLLEGIEVKGRAPKTGYTRAQFGKGWKDPDHNGCDTRNDVLARDLIDVQRQGPCTVISGTLHDPYTEQTITFERGDKTSQAVQIDHVVALSDAWQKGAQQLNAEQRLALANDPLNLLAVDGPTNTAKGDGDAATWLPPSRATWCGYVSRQVAVKSKYRLWMTPAEHDRIQQLLSTC